MMWRCWLSHKWGKWERGKSVLYSRKCLACGFTEKSVFFFGPPHPQPSILKRCWFRHKWGIWTELTPARFGRRNTRVCHTCGMYEEK